MEHKTNSIWAMGLLAGATFIAPSCAWTNDRRAGQEEAAQTAALLSCDQQAESETAEISKLSPIAPTSVLSPVLLLNDLQRRRQEEANQPRLLEQIEQKRQQCRKDVVAAATRRAQEVMDQRSDAARGYKMISFETFALDAKALAARQARISMTGSYLPDGNFEWLFQSPQAAMQARLYPDTAGNITKVPLVTEDASRELRRSLLKCKSTPGAAQMGCLTVVTGYVSLCSVTGPLGAGLSLPCFVVENGREVR